MAGRPARLRRRQRVRLAALGGGATPGFGGIAYSRDFSGAVQVKAGALRLHAGGAALCQGWRVGGARKAELGATASSLPFAREDIVVRPDARVGVEWAVTDHLSVAIEAGVGRDLR